MEHFLRFLCAGALALTTAAAAPAPGRVVPTSPEAAPATPAATPARKAAAPPGNAAADESGLTASVRAQADAEHQAARARCEVHPYTEQEACLREADAAYDRALAAENPG